MLFRIQTVSDLPLGYFERDYFEDRGECLEHAYLTPEAAEAAWKANYLGPDCDDIGISYLIVQA